MDVKDFVVRNNGVIMVKVITRSSCNSVVVDGDVLKIKIREIPENGRANVAIVDLLHKTLKIPKSCIEIVAGKTNSVKKIVVKV